MGRFVDPEPARPRDLRPTAMGMAPEIPNDDRSDAAKIGERVAKYIPAEIVAGYSVLIVGCKAIQFERTQLYIAIIVFLSLWIATPLYLIFIQNAKKEQWPQVVLATISFLGWAYSLGGPFAMKPLADYYSQPAGMVVTGLFSVLAGLFYKPKV